MAGAKLVTFTKCLKWRSSKRSFWHILVLQIADFGRHYLSSTVLWIFCQEEEAKNQLQCLKAGQIFYQFQSVSSSNGKPIFSGLGLPTTEGKFTTSSAGPPSSPQSARSERYADDTRQFKVWTKLRLTFPITGARKYENIWVKVCVLLEDRRAEVRQGRRRRTIKGSAPAQELSTFGGAKKICNGFGVNG